MGNITESIAIIAKTEEDKFWKTYSEHQGRNMDYLGTSNQLSIQRSEELGMITLAFSHKNSAPDWYVGLVNELNGKVLWRDLDGYGPRIVWNLHSSEKPTPDNFFMFEGAKRDTENLTIEQLVNLIN